MSHSKEHAKSVKQQLKDANTTAYGMSKFVSRYAPNVIHQDEKIKGVVHGRYRSGPGLLAFNSGMLIATDKRIIFLDHRPGYVSFDELTYDVVSGVKLSTTFLASALTLHTRLGDYTLRFVNIKAANNFVHYIESRRVEVSEKGKSQQSPETSQKSTSTTFTKQLDDNAITFLKEHDTAVLSTVDREGNVHGSVVYYLVSDTNDIFILTKSETTKARNILGHDQVALTIFEAGSIQTLSIQGDAQFETNQKTKEYVFSEIVKPRLYHDEKRLPPVTQLTEGSFSIIRITPSSGKYVDYKKLERS